MDAKEFASAYGEAFGPAAGLPLLFWYSDGPVRAVPKVEGCFFKALAEAREGSAVSLNAANIGCGGGKFYTGFAPMPPFVPAFVSQKEHYKQTPEMVLEFIGRLGVPEARCGRGRGYYDKYLSRPDVHAVKVGVCFAHQLVGELPAEPHDVAMDYIITD